MATDPSTRRPAGKRVLVCDDERHAVRLIQVNLEKQGYEVTCGYDGREAMHFLETQAFDAAILDVMMPYHDGFEILKWIRTHDETKEMWVGLVTAMANEAPNLHLPYEPDLFILKPINSFDFW